MRRATYPIVATLLATPAIAQDRPLTVDMTEVYSVGGVNAQEWAFFGPALPMSFDGVGNLLVLDVVNNRIVEQILQGWRAPRPGVSLSSAGEADWSRVVATMEDRYFEPEFHWDVLPDGAIAYSDSSAEHNGPESRQEIV